MDTLNHAAEAERLLAFLTADYHGDADWAQVLATRALAHATLAGLPKPIRVTAPQGRLTVDMMPAPQQVWPTAPQVWCSTDRDEMDPIVIWRGKDLRD